MKRYIYMFMGVILLLGCYVSKEHKKWDKRNEKGLEDKDFYEVLKIPCLGFKSTLKMNRPYTYIKLDGYYHSYTFDTNQRVYSNAWINTSVTNKNILSNQHHIGYYKICGDTLTIEQITSWSFRNRPWKYTHEKILGFILGDTIKLSRSKIDVKDQDEFIKPLSNYVLNVK